MKIQIISFAQRFKGNDLRAQCARSGAVLTVGTVAAKGLAFLSKMILVRLLIPEEMGLMVLVLSLTALFETLTEVGIKQSVIQNKDGAKSEYLNTAWWFQSMRAVGLYVVAFVVAPSVCRFYFADMPDVLAHHAWPELYLLVRVAFLSILFNGLVSPRAHVLEKEFQFGKAVLITQGSAILGAGITIVLAFTLRNVWAMVIGFASMTLLRCLLSFILCPFLPRLSFDKDSFRSLYKFARGIFGSPILTYVAYNADVLVAGKIVTPQLLGMYGMALALAGIPRELFARIIGPVLLPAFAKKQDDHQTLCAVVLRITRVTVLFVAPFAAIAAVCGKTILSIVFTEEYSDMAVPFGILCFYILILMQGIILTTVLLSIGKPSKHRAFVGLRAVLIALFIFPATKIYGLTGAAAVLLVCNLCALFMQFFVMRGTIGLGITNYLFAWLPGLVFTVPGVVVALALRYLVPERAVVHLAAGIVAACVAVVVAYFGIPKGFELAAIRSRFAGTAVGGMKDEQTENVT